MPKEAGALATRLQPVRWTGHPFVDAGIAAMCAAVGLRQPGELTSEHVVQAVGRLKRVLLSDQALGVGTDRNFATGPLSFVFPNSELVNPSHWRGGSQEEKAALARQKFLGSLEDELADALACVDAPASGGQVCPMCGRRCPGGGMRELRKNHLPLALGIVNFYPAFQPGMRTCALCALALRFLPLSTMNAGGQRLWILHSQADGVAAGVSRRYGWEHFERAIATRTAVDFYRFGSTGRGAAPVVYLMFELLEQFGPEVQAAYQRPYSTVAYFFINDNRRGYVEALPIPSRLLQVLYRLRVRSRHAYRRFWHELLTVDSSMTPADRQGRERFVEWVAYRLIRGEPVAGACLREDPMHVLGGWEGHRLYLEGVRDVPRFRLALLERVGQALAGSTERKRWVDALRRAQPGDVYALFLDLVRAGFLRSDEFYALLPPGGGEAAAELRDVLLAVVYEAVRCGEAGEPFPALGGEGPPPPDEALQRLMRVGRRVLEGLDNVGPWVGALQTARSPAQIRRVYLRAVQRGAMGFQDFLWLSPLGDATATWERRDYLLAFLFDALREQGEAFEGSTADDEPVYEVQQG